MALQQGPTSHSAEEAQKRQILSMIALGMMGGGIIFTGAALILWLQGSGSPLDVAGGTAVALVGAATHALNRRGRVRPAGFLMVGLMTALPAYFLFLEGSKTTGILLFAAGVVFADFLIGGGSGLVVATIDLCIYVGIGLAAQFGAFQPTLVSPILSDLAAVAVITFGLALPAGLLTRGMRQILRQTQEREGALRIADEEKTRLLAELQAREETRRRLLETVRELGSPVIPLAQGIIAMPLIGVMDRERAQGITVALLAGVETQRARVAIVDITGVPAVDTVVAEELLKAAQGVRLLGAEVVLTGVQPEVAQTLVGLNLNLASVVTRGTLQEGLAYARRIQGAPAPLEERPHVTAEPAASARLQGEQR